MNSPEFPYRILPIRDHPPSRRRAGRQPWSSRGRIGAAKARARRTTRPVSSCWLLHGINGSHGARQQEAVWGVGRAAPPPSLPAPPLAAASSRPALDARARSRAFDAEEHISRCVRLSLGLRRSFKRSGGSHLTGQH